MLLKMVNFILAGMFVFVVFLTIGLSLPEDKPRSSEITLYNKNKLIQRFDENGKPDGVSFEFRPDGSVAQKLVFYHGELVQVTTYNECGEPITDPSTSLPELAEKPEHATSDPFHQSVVEKHHNSDTEQSPQEP